MPLISQTLTLTRKNWLIIVNRHTAATFIRAFFLPIILLSFLSYARNLFVPAAVFGISGPQAIRSFPNALAAADGRDRVVFVNNGFKGGEIERVINELSEQVRSVPGKEVLILEDEGELTSVCRASLRGVTTCFGAVVFKGSPTEGDGGDYWNYTIRADGALGLGRINIEKDTNDGQVFMLPLARAVDNLISGGELEGEVEEYPFTSLTKEERQRRVKQFYQKAIINFLGVTFVAGLVGVVYHLTGFVATERETGMSTLVEAMMVTKGGRWKGQAARIVAYHLAFSAVYLPGWVVGSLILWRGVFSNTSFLVILVLFILAGLALGSFSIFGAAFFKKSQLSGVCVTIFTLLLAIISQILTAPKTGPVVALSLLFPPCTFTFFIHFMARYEREEWGTNLVKTAPESPWSTSGIVLFIFFIIQIIVYPILGALVERWLHGTTSSGRNIVIGDKNRGDLDPNCAVQLEEFTKVYKPGFVRRLFSFISKPKEPVVAVSKLTLSANRGQILALLGANGSGKSTTLDTIAGINKATSGKITIDGTGGLGIAPQKNVLWDELTVEEHIRIFNKLKSPKNHASKEEIRQLVVSIDLEQKIKAHSKTLSGGQKRKLQLGMMLTGGSAVCCVDEVSSGLDPLSRRKIWDILLAERGKRTMILTTHFLDEADLLADYIAVMSKGNLRASGTSVELKNRLGGGYRIHVNSPKLIPMLPDIDGVTKKATREEASYIASTSALAATVIKELEAAGISDYRFSGPTIEDVFLQLAEEVQNEGGAPLDVQGAASSADDEKSAKHVAGTTESAKPALELISGQRIGYLRQTWVLFLKRCTIFKYNWFPSIAALVIPVAAAGLVMLFVKGQQTPGCSPAEQSSREEAIDIFAQDFDFFLVGGPDDSRFSTDNLARLMAPIFLNTGGSGSGSVDSNDAVSRRAVSPSALLSNITLVNSLGDFTNAVEEHRKDITPAAIWLGDDQSRPRLAWKGNGPEMINSWFGIWVMDMLLANTTIASTYVNFDVPFSPSTGDSLQLLVYISLALAAYPGFFSLYPNLERRRNVRGLQYSNGVKPLPLWLAYTAFDFLIVLAGAVISIAIMASLASQLWYHIGYVFLVFILYGLASTLLAYNISLISANQLSAYAFTAAGQLVLFLVYIIAYMSVITYVPAQRVDDTLIIVHFVISAFAPIASVCRALFLALNLFSTACDGDSLASYPGGILQYGGPILYLILQSIILFVILVWADSGSAGINLRGLFSRKSSSNPDAAATEQEAAQISDEEVAAELVRVKSSTTSSSDGLRVINLVKSFKSNTAVDNVTFSVPHGEVFALLGPNGAGKSTTISLIRGDIKPSLSSSDILIEDYSVTRQLGLARSQLGVCPQFDAVDQMTVTDHLKFYARVRGIPDIDMQVSAVLRAVGLESFRHRQAHALSGGNKRKLSLGIALMGNPSVILLDEPSSGLDAAAKRIMWRTLVATVPGRSILLTTHSMEEADALASRAGILAKRMLALGTTDTLRKRFGDQLHVHLVCKGAPHTSEEQILMIRKWVAKQFGGEEEGGGVEVEDKTYHGQMRFKVPASAVISGDSGDNSSSNNSAIGRLVVLLEEHKEVLGVEHYSVSPTTLDQVFLTVVGRHNIREEGYEVKDEKKNKKWWKRK
ncbi:putative transporter [Cladorrhinum sp. PSN332]|nr:putative transporter [Cladorrhinum sp. PSN332]